MRKTIAISLLLVLVFSAFALAAAKKGNWTGTISDDKCFAAKKKHDPACVEKCLAGGGKAVLVVGKNAYTITNADAIKGHEGHHVKVTGELDAAKKELTVEKVEMVQAKAKKGKKAA
ncbi:MAG TPA: hypothetical protein VGQ81_09455 [Acidobacteriota bacterium]|jgi:hypothetical protein|nr:hypothetical protein [Acidobacteriota bacterium]